MEIDINKIFEAKTTELLATTKNDGTLNFYFDNKRCKENEIVRIWENDEQIVLVHDALKFDRNV